MSIIIKAHKKVSRGGIEGYKVTFLKALIRRELPEAYIVKGKHCFWFNEIEHSFVTSPADIDVIWTRTILKENRFYSTADFEARKAEIEIAGERLVKINERLKVLRDKWKGEIVFVI